MPIDLGRLSSTFHLAKVRRWWTVVHQHRLVAGALVGLGFAVVHHLVSRYWPWTLGPFLDLGLLLGVAIVALALVCWPLVRYSDCMRVCAAFSGGVLAIGSTTALVRWPDPDTLVPWVFPIGVLGSFVMLYGVSCGILSMVTFVRTRYWPVYPEGHCRECGYNLFGAPGTRCPECGTVCSTYVDNGKGIQST